MARGGWFKVWRKVKDNPVWDDERLLKMWIYCIDKARYEDGPELPPRSVKPVLVRRGQFLTTRRLLRADFDYRKRHSEKAVWNLLITLQHLQSVVIKTGTLFSLITVCNYDLYQDSPGEKGPVVDRETDQKRTTWEPEENHLGTTSPARTSSIKELKKERTQEGEELAGVNAAKNAAAEMPGKPPGFAQDELAAATPGEDPPNALAPPKIGVPGLFAEDSPEAIARQWCFLCTRRSKFGFSADRPEQLVADIAELLRLGHSAQSILTAVLDPARDRGEQWFRLRDRLTGKHRGQGGSRRGTESQQFDPNTDYSSPGW